MLVVFCCRRKLERSCRFLKHWSTRCFRWDSKDEMWRTCQNMFFIKGETVDDKKICLDFSSYFFGKYSTHFPLVYEMTPYCNAEIWRVISLETSYIGFRRQTPRKTYPIHYNIYYILDEIAQPPLWKLLGATATLGPAGTETFRDPAPSWPRGSSP